MQSYFKRRKPKMKKILTLILALTMAVGLCACGGGEEAPA